jgi:hypothetical protein
MLPQRYIYDPHSCVLVKEKKEYALTVILHCQPIPTMFSALSLHFLDMTWKIDSFLLDDRAKLFYTVSASPLNSFSIVLHFYVILLY